MASECVQAGMNYKFADVELLYSALKAADRSDDGGPADDGNRGLSVVGCVLWRWWRRTVPLSWRTVPRTGDVDSRGHWFSSIQGRARACRELGMNDYVIQSIRQQHEEPSSAVLSYTLAAIIGAIWLDLEKQDKTISTAQEQISEVLRRIDVITNTTRGHSSMVVERTSPISEGIYGIQSSIPGEVLEFAAPDQILEQDITPLDASMIQWFDQNQDDELWDMDPTLFSFHDIRSGIDNATLNEVQNELHGPEGSTVTDSFQAHAQETSILDFNSSTTGGMSDLVLSGLHGVAENSAQRILGGVVDTPQGSSNSSQDPQTVLRPRKRKDSNEHLVRPHKSTLHHTLLHEELRKLNSFPRSIRGDLEVLLDDPRIDGLSTNPHQATQLRFFYLLIGSCQSIIELRENLLVAKYTPSSSAFFARAFLCPSERFREICRLDKQESLCVLARRYHIVKLFKIEQENLRLENEMLVETPSSFRMVHRAQAGNPTVRQEATLTERLLCKLEPELRKGTAEFNRIRSKFSRLRRLARMLQILTETYGDGILALIPCGPTYSELTITDSWLLSITEERFRNFADLLYQQQGPFLMELSKAVEPALTTLMNGNLDSVILFPIEATDVSVFEGLPKGSPGVFEHLLRQSSRGLGDRQLD